MITEHYLNSLGEFINKYESYSEAEDLFRNKLQSEISKLEKAGFCVTFSEDTKDRTDTGAPIVWQLTTCSLMQGTYQYQGNGGGYSYKSRFVALTMAVRNCLSGIAS
jgi:hypothetical protein